MMRVLLILDDIVGKDSKNSDEILQLFANGRHQNISVIILIQDMTFMPTTIRSNTDLFFTFYNKDNRSKEFVINGFMSGLIDEDDLPTKTEKSDTKISEMKFLKKLIKDTCQNHQCIVVDYLKNNQNDFREIVYKYKAPTHKGDE